MRFVTGFCVGATTTMIGYLFCWLTHPPVPDATARLVQADPEQFCHVYRIGGEDLLKVCEEQREQTVIYITPEGRTWMLQGMPHCRYAGPGVSDCEHL